MKPIALYIHVPFCARKCAYCDFASFSGMESIWREYFAALHAEIEQWKDELHDRKVCSLFFGGGTPSLVPEDLIAGIVEHLRKISVFAENAEITLEANPGTLTSSKLSAYRNAGINRLSMGVQSFDPDLLHTLGRIHDPDQAIEAVYLAKDAGFNNLNIDLMYALPGQTMRQWQDTLSTAIQLPITHVSAYSLILEDGTEMKRRADAGTITIPDEDTVNDMQRYATMLLGKNGYRRYEISNYAIPGSESRHNLAYWTDMDYLGLGSAAHSLVNNIRFSNPSDPVAYISGVRQIDRSERSIADHMQEVIMLSTRTIRGLDLEKWKLEFGCDFEKYFEKPLKKLISYGLVNICDGYCFCTEPGLELQDSVVLELMEEL